jgi:16S rRNA (cytosine967-C5)-methyltransferase
VGSIAICDVVSPCESLLDCCAAPGGKSVLLAKKCGQVTSFELHEHRVELIRQYKERMGVENVNEMQKDSSVFDKAYEEKFDAVLCDAPCSGYGTVSENPDVKLFRKKEDFAALEKAQRGILATVSKYVKKGGALYYSTCSLFERENDKTVAEFLQANPDYEVEKIDSPLAHEKKKYGLQFLPDTAYGAGFYVCKLIRK